MCFALGCFMDGLVLCLPHELGQRQGSRHYKKETHPVLLETILGAEKTVFHTQLQACGTLQGSCIIVTIDSKTLSL